jgi:hypothetical protein
MNDSSYSGQEAFTTVIDDTATAEAWGRSDGRCECRSLAHGHDLRCNRMLVWPNRGRVLGRGAWSLRARPNGSAGPHIEVVCAECAAREAARGA